MLQKCLNRADSAHLAEPEGFLPAKIPCLKILIFTPKIHFQEDMSTDSPIQKLSVVLVDSDLYGIRDMQRYVLNTPELELLHTCKTGRGALNFFKHEHADLMIINPALPDANGFDLIASLIDPPQIIVVAERPDYAYFAYRIQAVDYLLKPVAHEQMDQVVKRVLAQRNLLLELETLRNPPSEDIS
jgi:DNA-binding NtrC family response regulator